MIYTDKDFPAIPEGFIVISRDKYERMVRREIACETILMNIEDLR